MTAIFWPFFTPSPPQTAKWRHCYLRWIQVHDFLLSFSPWWPFAVQIDISNFLLSFFGCWPNWRTKKAARHFAVLLVTFWRPKLKKRTAKGHATFFVLQKDAKKTPKGRRANFVLHLVGNLFWTPKGRLCKKDGKKSWHLHSAWVILSVAGVWLSLTYVWKPWCWE